MRRVAGLGSVVALLAGGCAVVDGLGGTPVGEIDAGGGPADAATDAGCTAMCRARVGEFLAFATLVRDVDLLFVIDNSGSMLEEQLSLAANFPTLESALGNVEGGLPNLHIGVVSSNVGAGGFNLPMCAGNGDNGVLQNTARVGMCTPPTGYFISDIADGMGGRTTNYTGALADAFSCIAQLGTDGCGFEQHLESMKRALDGSNPQNGGFLRPSAFLVVAIVADEDDCSASSNALFDPADPSITGVLGPLSSFRCTEFGVDCDGGHITRSPRGYTTCYPRQDSAYVRDPQYYVDFLRSIKDPALLYVVDIVGPPTPFTVSIDPMSGINPLLDFACMSPAGQAAPSPRFKAFADAFGDRASTSSICNGDLTAALQQIAPNVTTITSNSCLDGPLYDTSPGAPGLQPDCRVYDVDQVDTPAEVRTELAPCFMGTEPPCYELVVNDATCPTTDTHMSVTVQRDPMVTVPPTTRVIVDCLRP